MLLQRVRLHVDSEAALGGEHARRTGRSWWALLYTDGRIVHEWDPDPGSPNGHVDWPRLASLGRLRGIRALRLYCPNGRMVELGGQGDQTGLLFQFKVAVRHVGVGVGTLGREVLAHVAGQIAGFDGQCRLFAWELLPEPPRPRAEDFLNAAPGSLADAYSDWQKLHRAWKTMAGGQLVGPLQDNVYELKYQQVGRLSAEVLGIVAGEGR